MKAAKSKCKSRWILLPNEIKTKFLPGMNIETILLPPQLKVKRKTILNDLVAGLIMAIIAIPNGLGGSVLAGINHATSAYPFSMTRRRSVRVGPI